MDCRYFERYSVFLWLVYCCYFEVLSISTFFIVLVLPKPYICVSMLEDYNTMVVLATNFTYVRQQCDSPELD